jgi:hypothetical protein
MFDDFFMKSFYNLNLIITKRGRGKRAKKKTGIEVDEEGRKKASRVEDIKR